MAAQGADSVITELQHFNTMAQNGQDFRCELNGLERNFQLKLARAVAAPDNHAYVTNLKLVAEGDGTDLNLRIQSKLPVQEACQTIATEGHAAVSHRPEAKSVHAYKLPVVFFNQGEITDAHQAASAIEKLVPMDLKEDDSSQGWLRKKLCDLMQTDKPTRDSVLSILEKDGATVQRDGDQPVSIKFSQYFGFRQDTIPLTMSFAELAKASEQKWDAGVE